MLRIILILIHALSYGVQLSRTLIDFHCIAYFHPIYLSLLVCSDSRV